MPDSAFFFIAALVAIALWRAHRIDIRLQS
jgi:hypothetical protein